MVLLLRFGLIRSYGILEWPDLAAAAFDDMRRLGVWQPSDVKTANALLNALHADADKTYERYSWLLVLRTRHDDSLACHLWRAQVLLTP